jgi:outer membrane protein assembly factor BamB
MRVVWVVGLVVILSAQATRAADWPCWRGSERNGISLEKGLNWQWDTNSLPVRWRASVGKGFSSFAVAGGRAVTMGNSGGTDAVWCFDAEKGTVLWKHAYPCDPQPLSYEGGPGATAAIASGRVFTFSKSGDLFCLDAQSGKVIWSKRYDLWPWTEGDWKNTWRYAGSPLVMGDVLYLSVGRSGVALNAKDGSVYWESVAGHPGYSSPVPFLDGRKSALAFFSGRAVIGTDAQTGRLLWEIPWKTEWDFNAADPVISDGKLFVSSGNNAGCALYDISVNPPRECWRNKALKTSMNSAVLWQGHVYGFNDTDLSCVAWATGEVKWAERSIRRGSLLLAEGRLLALSETGKWVVASASPEGFRPVLQAQVLTGRCWTSPALSNGLLFLRNAQGEVVCMDARLAAQ